MDKNVEVRLDNTLAVKVERNSNLELYRIIVMLLIVASHYVVNSGLTSNVEPMYSNPLSCKSLFLLIFGGYGKTGINCFVLITGYFMCKSKITLKKFCKLLFEVMFYNIVIWIVFLIAGYETFSIKGLVYVLFPVTSIGSNFTACYLVFYLLIPFINILIHNMTERQHLVLLAILLFSYVVLGSFSWFSVTLNYVSWFIVLYLISSYIRLYEKPVFNKCALWGWVTLALFLLSVGSIVLRTWLVWVKGAKIYGAYFLLADSNKILAVLLGVSSFLFFKNLRMKNSKIINTIAASTFGVLLIHANSNAMRKWLWQDLLDNVGMYQSKYMVLHAIGSVLAIFIICVIIDHMRIQLLEKPLFKQWDKYVAKRKQQVALGGAVAPNSSMEVAADIAPKEEDAEIKTSVEEKD